MNIFALSRNPQEAAQEMLDKHIVKMPTETCQMLHTNVLYFDYIEHYGEEPTLAQVKQFHKDINSNLMKLMLNHPSTIIDKTLIILDGYMSMVKHCVKNIPIATVRFMGRNLEYQIASIYD